MKTIRVIDLLNKIANDENYKNIKFVFNDYLYTWNEQKQDYDSENTGHLKVGLLGYLRFDDYNLNRTIEIIEDTPKEESINRLINTIKTHIPKPPKEDKKIEKIEERIDTGLVGTEILDEFKVAGAINKQASYIFDIAKKINEIIDRLNGEDNGKGNN